MLTTNGWNCLEELKWANRKKGSATTNSNNKVFKSSGNAN
jgi:hypothetical protein